MDNAIPDLVELLRQDPRQTVEVHDNIDDVCYECPLFAGNGCGRDSDPVAQNDKLRGWDREILTRLGLASGDRIPFTAIVKLIETQIPDIGEICTDCASSKPNGFSTFKKGLRKGLVG